MFLHLLAPSILKKEPILALKQFLLKLPQSFPQRLSRIFRTQKSMHQPHKHLKCFRLIPRNNQSSFPSLGMDVCSSRYSGPPPCTDCPSFSAFLLCLRLMFLSLRF